MPPLLSKQSRSGGLSATDPLQVTRERVLDRMLNARWLHAFMFSEERGWRLIWTTGGAQRALLLKAIIKSYDLGDDDHAPLAFTILARSGNFADIKPMAHPDVLVFWLQCCDEIGLPPVIEDCLTFVQIISA
jgi:hypothetical protein